MKPSSAIQRAFEVDLDPAVDDALQRHPVGQPGDCALRQGLVDGESVEAAGNAHRAQQGHHTSSTRIRELRHLEKELKALREQCVNAREAEHCGILNELVQASSLTGVRSASAHVSGPHDTRERQRHSSTLG